MEQHKIISNYIDGLASGQANSMIVVSKPGLGKTETTLKALNDKGYHLNKHFAYLSNYLTPRALVNVLESTNELQEPKILVLDDVEDTLNNLQSIGVLKGALWNSIEGKRMVCWITARQEIQFSFTGRIIFLINKIDKKNEIINALIDRGYFYNMQMSNGLIIQLLIARARQHYDGVPLIQRLKVVNYIAQTGVNSKNLSLRVLPKALSLFRISPNHWRDLVKEIL